MFVRPRSVASGLAATLIPEGWPEPRGERRAAGHLVAGGVGMGRHRQRPRRYRAGARRHTVHAHPARHRHAPTDGRGARLAGRADRLRRPRAAGHRPGGWGAVGHPEWGPFRLGKTNPNFSTSGLNFTIAEYYAATGKTSGLTVEDLARPAAVDFATQIESAVVHYGDITMTFLNNWFAADARGTALTYTSAVAVEEKSVIDYNRGNPDGVLQPGEEPRIPRDPLVAIYPEEGTLYSDNPFIVSNTEWVDDDEKAAAALFGEFVQLPENQQKVMEFGFRPNNPSVAAGRPDRRRQRRRPEPADGRAAGAVAGRARRDPRLVGRPAQGGRVLLVLDISGSMGEPADDQGRTRLDLAKEAAVSALDEFKPTDDVGLWVFSTELGGARPERPRAGARSVRSASSRTRSPGRSRRSSRPTARRSTR